MTALFGVKKTCQLVGPQAVPPSQLKTSASIQPRGPNVKPRPCPVEVEVEVGAHAESRPACQRRTHTEREMQLQLSEPAAQL